MATAFDQISTAESDTENSKDNKQSLLYVKKGDIFGGYALHLLKEDLNPYIKTFVICSKCEGLLREACGVGDPQVFMCLSCAQEKEGTALKPNREAVDNLILVCPLKSRGCDWEGKVSESEAHLDECEFIRIDCELLCGIVVERRNMPIHISTNCLHKEIQCEFCTFSFKVKEVNMHRESCDEFPLQCPNHCGGVFKRRLKRHHVDQECENTVLECPYKEYGCEVKIVRKELEEHTKENRLIHLEFKTESVCKKLHVYQDENQKLKEEVSTLKHFSSAFEGKWIIRIGNVKEMSSMATPIANFVITNPKDSDYRNLEIFISCYKSLGFFNEPISKFIMYITVNRSKVDTKFHKLVSDVQELKEKFMPSLKYETSSIYKSSARSQPQPAVSLKYNKSKNSSAVLQKQKNEDKQPSLCINGCAVILNQSDQTIHSKHDYFLSFDLEHTLLVSQKVLIKIDYDQILHPDVCVNDEILVHVYYNQQQNIQK